MASQIGPTGSLSGSRQYETGVQKLHSPVVRTHFISTRSDMQKASETLRALRMPRSPWLELGILASSVVLSYVALLLISMGAAAPQNGMGLIDVVRLMFGFFLLSFAIAVLAVLAGIGGGVIYTPLMMAFTPVNSLIIRATGLIVAMFNGLVSSGPFMKSGVGNLKLSIICTLGYGLGGFAGAQGAIWLAQRMGVAGEGIIRVVLGSIVLVLGIYFLWGGRKTEWAEAKPVDTFSKRLGIQQSYYEPSIKKTVTYEVRLLHWNTIAMVGIGAISGFFGMGAGWAVVPALNLIVGVPLKVAAATSHVIIGMGDCITVWPYMLIGAIIPLFAAPWLVGQVLGGIVGAQALIKARSQAIRFILAGIMVYTSFGLVTDGLVKLSYISKVPGGVNVAVLLAVLAVVSLAIVGKGAVPFRRKRT